QAFRRNMDYSSLVLSSLTLGPHFAWLIKTLGPLLLKGGWLACLLAAVGLVFSKIRTGANAETLITLWLGTAIVGVCTGFFFFPHYFVQVLPPLALAAAMGARWAEGRWSPLSRGPWLALAVSLLPALAYSNLYFGVPRSIASVAETPELLARK